MTLSTADTKIRTPFFFPSLRHYQGEWLRPDLIAGLTVWAVLIPESLAYATIAGVSPVVGLYAAPPALFLYAAFGSSRHLVTGPMAATAALSASVVADFATDDGEFLAFTIVLAIVTGVIALVGGLIRLGFVANFISEPVLKGFIIGLALTIMVGQLPKLFGIEGGDGNFFEKLWAFLTGLGGTEWTTLLIGAVSLALVIGLREFAPAIPGSLVAVAFGIAAVAIFDLGSMVDIVGDIQSGLSSFGLPDAAFSDYLAIAPACVGVMLIGFAEGLGAAKTYAAKNHYEIDPNRELMGLGAANIGSGLFGGMVVNGSLSKTAVNGGAGARTQLSGLVVAVLTVLTLLFLTGLFSELPEATLAAIVIAALVELVDIKSMRKFFAITSPGLERTYGIGARADFIGAAAALLGVLLFDTLPGLIIGIVISLLLLIYRSSHPNVVRLGLTGGSDAYVDLSRHPEAVEPVSSVAIRVEAGLYFANSDHVRKEILRMSADRAVKAVILDTVSVPFIDYTAALMIAELSEQLRSDGLTLVIARDIGQVRDVLSTSVDDDRPPHFPSVRAAVEWVDTELASGSTQP